jgi:hypothetical protein
MVGAVLNSVCSKLHNLRCMRHLDARNLFRLPSDEQPSCSDFVTSGICCHRRYFGGIFDQAFTRLGVRIPPKQNLQPPALVILGGFSHDPRSGWTDVLRLARVPVELVFYSRLSFCHLTIGVYRELCITVFADSQYREIREPLYDSKVAPWHGP